MRTILTECRIVSPGRSIDDGRLLIINDKIGGVFTARDTLPPADRTVDLGGLTVMPGFIDVHCHGRGGHDFSDGDAEGAALISQEKLREGVTTLLPTTLTLPQKELLLAAAAVRRCVTEKRNGCKLPGLHLEGPFVSKACLGAQNPDFARLPDLAEVLEIDAVYPVRKVTFAVELPGGSAFAAALQERGITPSCGHSNARYKEFLAAYRAGVRDLTHFGNRMSGLHHREIGLVGAGMLHPDLFLELIADKIHLAPEMVKLLFQLRGSSHLLLVTDALRCTGMTDGAYVFGGVPFTLKEGEARLEGGALAGSTLTMNRALKNVCEQTGLPLPEVVGCTSWNQAQSLHLEGVGRIEPGFAADLAILDKDFSVVSTWVNGAERFHR